MNTEFSFKELYDVSLKATYPIEIGNRSIEEGEVIAFFDKITIANMNDVTSVVSARGGYNNAPHVFWDATREVQMNFTQGIFSTTQLGILFNSKVLNLASDSITITKREALESDENKEMELMENPSGKVFVYDEESGEKVNFTRVDKIITVDSQFKNYIVDYEYLYSNEGKLVELGKKLLTGYVSLEGRTKIKEDISGQVKTGIIKIPKLKIVSNMSIRLGRDALPMASTIKAIAVPTEDSHYSCVMELFLLEDDIDSDM